MAGILRLASLAASLIVLTSFGLFALDETRNASEESAATVAGLDATRVPNPSAGEERARERAHNDVREAIDDANDVLVAPFAPVAEDWSSSWARRGVPALLALIVYGFGLSFLARYVTVRA